MKISELLNAAEKTAKDLKVKLYPVGGFVRDTLLKKENITDLDFVVAGNLKKFAEAFAKRTKGSIVNLSKEFQITRVVVDKTYTCDFSKCRGKSIENDLAFRDFTINALALDADKIIDVYGGVKDLKSGRIIQISKNIYKEDPLRLLRAVRLAAALDFKLDTKTTQQIKKDSSLIKNVSAERVRDELLKILSAGKSADYILLLDKLKVLSVILPELKKLKGISQPGYHHLDVWEHTLEAIRQIENHLRSTMDDVRSKNETNLELGLEPKIKTFIKEYLDEKIGQTDRRTLLKLFVLFHDIAKPETKSTDKRGTHFYLHELKGAEKFAKAGKRLRLSNDVIKAGKLIIKNHLRTGYLTDLKSISKKAVLKFLRDCGEFTPEVLLLSWADRLSARGAKVKKKDIMNQKKLIERLFKEYYKQATAKPLPKLLNGYDIMKAFKLKPSPLIGELLDKVNEAQILGILKKTIPSR